MRKNLRGVIPDRIFQFIVMPGGSPSPFFGVKFLKSAGAAPTLRDREVSSHRVPAVEWSRTANGSFQICFSDPREAPQPSRPRARGEDRTGRAEVAGATVPGHEDIIAGRRGARPAASGLSGIDALRAVRAVFCVHAVSSLL